MEHSGIEHAAKWSNKETGEETEQAEDLLRFRAPNSIVIG